MHTLIQAPWNKGKIIGQRKPLKVSHIWDMRIRLELQGNVRDLALFNLALNCKLRGCDLVKLKVFDVAYGQSVMPRAHIVQQKTNTPVQFEITKGTRKSIQEWIAKAKLKSGDFLFKSRIHKSDHITTRQYNRIFRGWIEKLGLDYSLYSTHSMRRTKAYLIYQKTKNLSLVQLLLGHKKLESIVRYLGIEVDDALEISESIEV